MGLAEAVLHNLPVTTQECAEAIERLPRLRVLALDFLASDWGAFWAATLQQRMRGRCSVEAASDHVVVHEQGVVSVKPWPNDSW